MPDIEELQSELEAAKGVLAQIEAAKELDSPASVAEQERYIKSLEADIEDAQNPRDGEITPEAVPESAGGGLAIVIGHCSFREGACGVSPLSKCEWAYNAVVAEKIKASCDNAGIRCEIFTREWGTRCLISKTYTDRVAPWRPTCTVELHYNSGTPTPPYTVTLFAREDSRNWSLVLQDKIRKVYDRPDSQADKVWLLSPGQNGHSSTKHLKNSALLEPFFGSVASDAKMGHERVDELADAVFQSYVEFTGTPLVVGVEGTMENLAAAYRLYSAPPVDELNHLKDVTMAQWVKEAGWDPSPLARQHLNFSGMKWRDVMSDYATPVEYEAHDGVGIYCKFASLEDYIAGYFARLDLVSAYDGWRDHAHSPESFINFIGPIWAPFAETYADDVLSIIPRLAERGLKILDTEVG